MRQGCPWLEQALRRAVLVCLCLCLALPAWAQPIQAEQLVSAARQQVGVTLGYDPVYRRLDYPGGDVPLATGVCTDVLIRALRAQGLDLQQAVHEDMRAHFSAYPNNWGLKRPDRNIDHRRVPNLMTWLRRQGLARPPSEAASAYRGGDVVTWDLGNGLSHIGIVSDRRSAQGVPLILHNIGRGTREEDILFAFKVTGHYRFARP
ncbi:DUF1287 domain-containing protein [Pseudomonas sp. L-22-4S-12]|uniref:DUF1287 domain-containing protein n=1 Tax=Pseudomonas sp. L-22-4S-12 TaxID=2610893 RepID=UPI001324CBC4|nr:DUF1287 domain-containing protein [Pseudomonas sp. L-22-4S-12]MWV16708.1 DUF1287 domain-containing protein [Pseudomonas sp. L-22-4S-12]